MLVLSEDGGWVVLPQRAVWIPAGVTHQVRMLGSARAAPTSSGRARADARACEVVEVSPLLRQLLLAAVDMPAQYDRKGATARWPDCCCTRWTARRRCRCIPAAARRAAGGVVPGLHGGAGHPLAPQDWAGRLHMSPRSFSRHFREHTGMSYAHGVSAPAWCWLARLAAGDPVTVIALDFGYQGPAAFSTMFRRVLGAAPSAYLRTD